MIVHEIYYFIPSFSETPLWIFERMQCKPPGKSDSRLWCTICHLSKSDTATAVKEMERVLKREGLCFVNFTSVDDVMFGHGKKMGKGEFIQEEDWYPGIVKEGHVCSYYEDEEPDEYFHNFEIIRKEKRISELQIERDHPEGGGWQIADICYTAKKLI